VEEVEDFLRQFRVKMKIWDILFLSREKNIQTLTDLEITSAQRKKIIEDLEYKDYSEGPLEDKMMGGASMWVFGKIIKKREIYIKITLGKANLSVICISFHIAEHPIKFPLK